MLGVTESHFWNSCPTDLQPYVKMDEMQNKRRDYEMWQMGLYVYNAAYAAVATALAGKKAKAEYMDKPLSMQKEKEPKSDFVKFSEWAAAFNKNFETQNGQE